MIPTKLQLYNFMSYGENTRPLNFENIDLACFSGPNGAGKSSLLEAMVWALWGKSRAKSDDDLIKLGANEMWVDFEFELEGTKYKVIRKRTKKKRGQGSLEFMMMKSNATDKENFQKNFHWQSLSGTTKSETQQKIIEVLKMEYETFVNSAFLRQGHADEFTIKKPQERKAILSEILGLSYYDKLQEKAKELKKSKEIEKESLEQILLDIETRIQDKNKLEAEVKEAEKILSRTSKEIEEKEKEIGKIQAKKNALEIKQVKLNENLLRLKELKQEIESLEKQCKEEEKILKELSKFINKTKVKVNFSKLQEILSLLSINEFQENKEKQNKVKNKLRLLEEKKKRKKDLELEIQKNNNTKTRDETLLLQIEEEGSNLKEKMEALQKAKARCPLCEQNLSEKHKAKIEQELNLQITKKRDDYKKIKKEIFLLDKKNKELKKEADFLERDLETEEDLKKELHKLENFEENLVKIQKEIKKDLGDIKKVEEVSTKLKSLTDNNQRTKELEKVAKELKNYETEKLRLERAIEQEKAKKIYFEKSKNLLANKKAQLVVEEKKRRELQFNPKELVEINKLYEEETSKLQTLRFKISGEQSRYGAAKEKMEQLKLQEKEFLEKKEKLNQAVLESSIYGELSEAFGKKGIQAMIIESAIPEIEQEANSLLSKMTDGKLEVRFITQKEKKTDGELQETLDIQIVDDHGIRPYEMFSGGEAFRINFAIRIALSKLLARRAGAKLQLLVIDEGFGTQDGRGLENLIEAINSVKDDFKKILVITHLQELKDMFPMRIEVTKDEKGSKFEIVS